MRSWALAAVAATMLAVPAAASAVTQTYGGTTSGDGQVAMDIKFDRNGFPRKVVEVRGNEIPITCEQSGAIPGGANFRVNFAALGLSAPRIINGSFFFKNTDTYGNHSYFHGRFFGGQLQRVAGDFLYSNHFLAEGPYPEEDCTSGPQTFAVKRGGPDVQPPAPTRPAR